MINWSFESFWWSVDDQSFLWSVDDQSFLWSFDELNHSYGLLRCIDDLNHFCDYLITRIIFMVIRWIKLFLRSFEWFESFLWLFDHLYHFFWSFDDLNHFCDYLIVRIIWWSFWSYDSFFCLLIRFQITS